VDQLLSLDIPEYASRAPWPDYLPMGFDAQHVPELIRMVTDEELSSGGADEPRTYAGVHAWRWSPLVASAAANALGQIALRFPECRGEVVAVLTRQLGWWVRQHVIVNTALAKALVMLDAVESAPLVREARTAGAVFTDEDMQRLRAGPPRPRPASYAPRPGRAADPKRRRKAEKAARQRNRKRR
jgi:hypothetical protein